MKKRLIAIFLFIIMALSILSCAAQKNGSDGMAVRPSDTNAVYDEYYSGTANDKLESESSPSIGSTPSGENTVDTGGRKVILSSSFSIQTKDFTASCKALDMLISKHGGYVQSSDIYSGGGKYNSRTAYYAIRVPAENYLSIIGETDTIGTVVSRSDNNRDITEQYFDTEARLTTLKTKQERLLALLEEAKYIDDVISLNNALEETMYQIENLTGTLKKYDSLISYSTLEINIREVAEVTEPTPVNATLGQRIKEAFTSSVTGVVIFFEALLVFFVGAIPALIPIAIVVTVVVVIIRIKIKKKKAASKNISDSNL